MLPRDFVRCLFSVLKYAQLGLDHKRLSLIQPRLILLGVHLLLFLYLSAWLRLGQRFLVLPRYPVRCLLPVQQQLQLDVAYLRLLLLQHLHCLGGLRVGWQLLPLRQFQRSQVWCANRNLGLQQLQVFLQHQLPFLHRNVLRLEWHELPRWLQPFCQWQM